MNNVTILAIDLAKDVLQVCKVTSKNKISYNKSITRKALKELLNNEKNCLVAMEACASSQYWSRLALKLGLSVKTMHARHVKPFRTTQKTDRNDALAIAVAATQLTIKSTRILGRVDLCCTFRIQQYIGNHINMNASDNMLA
jgi:transposase